MDFDEQQRLAMTRRHFFGKSATGLGMVSLASLLNAEQQPKRFGGLDGVPHFAPKITSGQRYCRVWISSVKCCSVQVANNETSARLGK